MDIMDHLKHDTFAPLPEAEVDQAIGRLMQAVRNEPVVSVQPNQNVRRWISYAIATAAVIAIVFTVQPWGGSRTAPTTTGYTKTYSTILGQRATITLSDGSTAILAPVTRLTVTGRNVELLGEAVFTVNQHSGAPFTVKSGNTITRVLGTTFGVRAYDDHVRITVSDGRVSIASNVLSKNDVAIIDNGIIQIQHNTDVASLTSWTTGRLEFAELPFAQAIPELERWYGTKLSL